MDKPGQEVVCACTAKGLSFPHQHATLCPVFYEGVKPAPKEQR